MHKIKVFFKELIASIKNYFFCLKYPFWRFRSIKRYNDNGDCIYKTRYWTTWYEEIPDGWRKAFGKQLSKEILKAGKQYLKEHKKEHLTWDNLIFWQQIKEKWGELCLYASAVRPIMRILEKYEILSIGYCMNCGKPARYHTTGWITYVCENCFLNHYKKVFDSDSSELLSLMREQRLTKKDIPHTSVYNKETNKVESSKHDAEYTEFFKTMWGLNNENNSKI